MRLLLLLMVLVIAGCGREEPAPPPAPTPTPAPSPSPVPTPTPDPRPKTLELGEGLATDVLTWGEGADEAASGDTALLKLSIVGEDGKSVWEGKLEIVLGSGDGYPALERTVTGMMQGGKRRTAVPQDFAWKREEKPAEKHTLEVELLELKKAEKP